MCVCVCVCVCVFSILELSEVLWTMGMRRAIGISFDYGIFMGSLAIFNIFAFWAGKLGIAVGFTLKLIKLKKYKS